jgi:hypothetical protein
MSVMPTKQACLEVQIASLAELGKRIFRGPLGAAMSPDRSQ